LFWTFLLEAQLELNNLKTNNFLLFFLKLFLAFPIKNWQKIKIIKKNGAPNLFDFFELF